MNKRICVVGAGRWGKNHIRTLNELGYLAGIVEANSDTRAEFKGKYPDIQTFASVREAIKEKFDGFTVATPAETHFEIAKFIIEHKRHLLVEKPITTRLADAQQLKRLAEENGVNLMTGHLLLFHPAIRKIKELIEGGKIGKFEYIYSNRLNLGTVRTEENILWSFAPHDISIFQYFIGRFPIEIVSRGGAFLQPHIHDSSMTVLTYPDNIVGHIFVNWLHPFKEHRLVVVGSKGMLSYEDSSEDKRLLFYEKGIDWIQGEPIKRDGPTEVIPFDLAMPLTEELKYFVAHTNGEPVEIANAQNAVEVLEILERATGSLLSGGGQRTGVRGQRSEIRSQRTPRLNPLRGAPDGAIQLGKEVGSQTTEDQGFFAHPTAEIEQGALIGEGTKIWHFSHVMANARIGERCVLGQNVFVANDVVIGSNVKIQNNVSVYTGVILEDDVFCGPSCVFTNVVNPRSQIVRHNQYQQTLVKRGVTIGANATIVCGATIGRYAFIGAGAVVRGDVPDYALMMGVPAKQVGWMSRHGHRLVDKDADGNWVCPESKWRYREIAPGVLRCLDWPEDEPLLQK